MTPKELEAVLSMPLRKLQAELIRAVNLIRDWQQERPTESKAFDALWDYRFPEKEKKEDK